MTRELLGSTGMGPLAGTAAGWGTIGERLTGLLALDIMNGR